MRFLTAHVPRALNAFGLIITAHNRVYTFSQEFPMRRFEPDLLRVCFCVCKVQWVTDRLKNVIQVHNNNKMKSLCVEIIGPDGMAHKWVSPFWHLIFMRSVLCIVYKRWLVYFVCFGDRISLMPDSYAKAHATYRVALGPMQFFVCAMLFVCFIEPCVLRWRWRKQDSDFSGSYLRYIRSATGLLYLYLHKFCCYPRN